MSAFAEAARTFQMQPACDIEDLDGVVPKRRDEEALRSGIEGQMIDAAFDARKLDGAKERQGFLS